MAQLKPLPLTISCFSKIQIGFTFLVATHPGSPGQRVVKGCVCVYSLFSVGALSFPINPIFEVRHWGRWESAEKVYIRTAAEITQFTLELRRLHIDLIWCYQNSIRSNWCGTWWFFQLRMSTGTRGHAFKLHKPSANSSRSRFFASRVINIWNGLPQFTDFSSINAFKRSICSTNFFCSF